MQLDFSGKVPVPCFEDWTGQRFVSSIVRHRIQKLVKTWEGKSTILCRPHPAFKLVRLSTLEGHSN